MLIFDAPNHHDVGLTDKKSNAYLVNTSLEKKNNHITKPGII